MNIRDDFDEIQISSKAFYIKGYKNFKLFNNNSDSLNTLLFVIDPMKKQLTTISNEFKPFW